MCTNGVNTTQLEQMIDQIDDHVALEYRWTHKVGHTAGDADFQTPSKISTMHSLCWPTCGQFLTRQKLH